MKIPAAHLKIRVLKIESKKGPDVEVVLYVCSAGADVWEVDVSCEGDWLGGWFAADWLSAAAFASSRSLLMSDTKSSNPEKPFPFFGSAISLFLCLMFVRHETDLPRGRSVLTSGGSVF